LLRQGAEVVLNGRDEGRLAAAADALGTARTLAFDVADHAAARRAVDAFEAAHGPIDILVNNAGVQHRAPLEDFPPEEFERLLRTNVTSLFNVGQACARHMIARRRGKIVNIASVQTALARPSIAPYTATKGAVGALTRGMAADWAGYGINCNALAPGYIRTDINQVLQDDPAFDAWLRARTPAGRWGRVEDLVGACVFLSAPASDFVHGHVLYVDGGVTATV
jgi:gluconate 5-dehydrogenase